MSKKHHVNLKKHAPRDEELLLEAVRQLTLIHQALASAGIDEDSIIHLYAQAYASIGLAYKVDPDTLVGVLGTNGLAMGILADNPRMTGEELERAVEDVLNDDELDQSGESAFSRSTPDPDMPMFLAPGMGEA